MGLTFATVWIWDKIQKRDWKSSRCSLEDFYTKQNWKITYMWSNEYVNFVIETKFQSIDIDEIRHETPNKRYIKFGNKSSWRQQLAKEFTEFISLFKNFARTLRRKQHSFKERQNRATINIIQKGFITSIPKWLGNWEN